MFCLRFLSLTIVFSILACTDNSGGGTVIHGADSQSEEREQGEEQRAVVSASALNLGLPEDSSALANAIEAAEGNSPVDIRLQDDTLLPDLFERQQQEKQLSVSGRPTVSAGESPADLPAVTGAKVDVELKVR